MAETESETGDARSRFVDAKLERYAVEQKSSEYRKLTRDIWRAVGDELREVRDSQHIDSEIAGWLIHAIDELLCNQRPYEIEQALERTRGVPPDRLDIKEAKRYAILYVQAAKKGDVKDRHPIKTIADEYACSRQAVRDWLKRYPAVQWDNYQTHRTLEDRIHSLQRLRKRLQTHFLHQSRTLKAIDKRHRLYSS